MVRGTTFGRLAKLVDAEVAPWGISANVRVGASPTSSVMKGDFMRYKCIEPFETECDHYGYRHGHNKVEIGDVYVVVREPVPEKKLYKLKREVNNSKFDDGYLYLRKNFFKNHFVRVD